MPYCVALIDLDQRHMRIMLLVVIFLTEAPQLPLRYCIVMDSRNCNCLKLEQSDGAQTGYVSLRRA
jgi:hypothetical protein